MKDYEDSSLRGTRRIENTKQQPDAKASTVASHPIMAYRVVRRFSNEMKALEREFERNYEKGKFSYLLRRFLQFTFNFFNRIHKEINKARRNKA